MGSLARRNRIALVTGSSSGIGEAVCRELAGNGYCVIGCARRGERLENLRREIEATGTGEFHPMPCDQSKEEDILKLFQLIENEFGRLDASIINAGCIRPGPILNGKTEAWREMMEVNVFGTSVCLRESVRLLRNAADGAGRLVVIGSGLGHRVPPAPVMHFYSATKFAVRALTEAVRSELLAEKSKINVTHVSPGPVNTEAPQKTFAHLPADKVHEMLYGEYTPLSAQNIAQVVLFAITTPLTVNVNELSVNPIDGEAIPRPKNFT